MAAPRYRDKDGRTRAMLGIGSVILAATSGTSLSFCQ